MTEFQEAQEGFRGAILRAHDDAVRLAYETGRKHGAAELIAAAQDDRLGAFRLKLLAAEKAAAEKEHETCAQDVIPSDLGASLRTAIGAVVKPGSRVLLSVRQPDGSFAELVFTTPLPRST